MLDELLGRGFSSKCKSLIKVINSRLETIRRKKNCTLRLLRTDVEGLLISGQEMKAFDRAAELIVEQNLSTAYDMVEQFCSSILSNLSAIQKQRECPSECLEAVVSLMFAAARFADLPELRNLRSIFTERYGNALAYSAADLQTPDCAASKEFAEITSSKPPATDMKLKLMREISKESSIKWDSKAFEERIKNPHASSNVTARNQLPNMNGGHNDGDCEKGSQDAFSRRKSEPSQENTRDPNNAGGDQFHAKGLQESLYDTQSKTPVEHSRKSGSLCNGTVDEKNKGLPQRRSGRKTEPPLQQSNDPEYVFDERPNSNNGCKERFGRKSEVAQGHARKLGMQGDDMLDKSVYPDILSHGRCKTLPDYEALEKWDDAVDKQVKKKTLPNKREPALDISREPKRTLDEAYQSDEKEKLSHRGKPPYGFNKMTENTHERTFYKGNDCEISPHRPLVDDQGNLSCRTKPPFGDRTAHKHEHSDHENSKYEASHGRNQCQLDGKQEKLPSYGYNRRTEKMHEDTFYNSNDQESYDRDKLHCTTPPYSYKGAAEKMHGDAYYGGDDPNALSPRSPLGDDQQKLRHKSKRSCGYNRTSERPCEDISRKVHDHEIYFHGRRQSQMDDDQVKQLHGSKPPHGYKKTLERMHEYAYDDDNEHETLSQRHVSHLYDDQKKLHHNRKAPYNRTSEELHDDTHYEWSNNETFHRTRLSLDDKQRKPSHKSKYPCCYNRAAGKMHDHVSCRENDSETDEGRFALGCEKNGAHTTLRKGRNDSLAHESEVVVECLVELEEVDDRQIKSNNMKAHIKNVKPPYVISTGHKFTNHSKVENGGCNDHEDADYPPIVDRKGADAAKSEKPNHNRIIRPPSVVSKGGKSRTDMKGHSADSLCEQDAELLVEDETPAYRLPRTRVDHSINHERQGSRAHGREWHKEATAELGTTLSDKVPKPASVRQRHPRQAYVNTDTSDDYLHHTRKSTRSALDQGGDDDVHEPGYSRSRHKYREGVAYGHEDILQVDDKPRQRGRRVQHHVDEDDEEVIMDELLLHYSQKTANQVENKVPVDSKPPPHHVAGVNGHHTSGLGGSAKRAGNSSPLESSHAPNRAVSLPHEQPQAEERVKGHTRATSMQPDIFNGHVHPKLPDYNDLAVRFAALRRGSSD